MVHYRDFIFSDAYCRLGQPPGLLTRLLLGLCYRLCCLSGPCGASSRKVKASYGVTKYIRQTAASQPSYAVDAEEVADSAAGEIVGSSSDLIALAKSQYSETDHEMLCSNERAISS